MRVAAFVLALMAPAAAGAQRPAPAGMSLAEAAARRFPQPVRAGDLTGRTVLQPLERQPVLGRVAGVVRAKDGELEAVVAYGGVLGLDARLIAVPVDAMALLGDVVEVVGFTPAQLDGFPTYDAAVFTPVPAEETIRVGLARPSH